MKQVVTIPLVLLLAGALAPMAHAATEEDRARELQKERAKLEKRKRPCRPRENRNQDLGNPAGRCRRCRSRRRLHRDGGATRRVCRDHSRTPIEALDGFRTRCRQETRAASENLKSRFGNTSRKFEDFARALNLQRRVPLEKTKDLASGYPGQTVEGPLPMNATTPTSLTGLAAAIAPCSLLAVGLRSQGFDYVTEEEEDLIRDAQGFNSAFRCFSSSLITASSHLASANARPRNANRRRRTWTDYEREVKEASKVKDAEVRAKPVNPDIYLRKVTRNLNSCAGSCRSPTRSWITSTMPIDRKLPVREHVEALEKFLNEQLPRFAKLQAATSAETAALKAAISHSEEAIEDCQKALKTLPKTPEKRTRSKGMSLQRSNRSSGKPISSSNPERPFRKCRSSSFRSPD